jgi:uncharacterized protein YcbK (DUF882 family)
MNIRVYLRTNRGGDVKLSANFKLSEFECNCNICKNTLVDLDMVSKLQQVRTWWGKPISFSSAYRCPRYNQSIKGAATNSYHTKGMAVDISTIGMTKDQAVELFHYCEKLFNGCELGNGFVHCDTRDKKQNWTY